MRPTSRPEGRFEQLWLPLWPLASDNLREGIYRTSREKALDKRYIETNPDALSNPWSSMLTMTTRCCALCGNATRGCPTLSLKTP